MVKIGLTLWQNISYKQRMDKQIFETLSKLLGNHSNAARWLGFAVTHYRALRNGKCTVPKKTADYIRLKAAELEALAAVNGGKLPASALGKSARGEVTSDA